MNAYNIALFQDITGIELSEEQIPAYERAEKRAYRFLESELGWSFNPSSTYDEYGTTKNECICPKDLSEITKNLDSSQYEEGIPMIFPYDKDESHIFINPAKSIYKLKLAIPLMGSDTQFVSIKTLDNVMPRAKSNIGEIIRYIERCDSWPTSSCGCECPRCAMLVVWADWLKELPQGLIDVFTDLIVYYMKHPYSLDDNRIIKTESVDGHSVSYGDTQTIEDVIGGKDTPLNKQYLTLIKSYMGPFSPYYTKVRI